MGNFNGYDATAQGPTVLFSLLLKVSIMSKLFLSLSFIIIPGELNLFLFMEWLLSFIQKSIPHRFQIQDKYHRTKLFEILPEILYKRHFPHSFALV